MASASPGICHPDVAPLDLENNELKSYVTHAYSIHSGAVGVGETQETSPF